MIFLKLTKYDASCTTANDGENIYNLVKSYLENECPITIDFSNMEQLSEEFLKYSIVRIFKYFKFNFLLENLRLINLSQDTKLLLKKLWKDYEKFDN